MTDDVMIYYTDCYQGGRKLHYAIQAESYEAYIDIVTDCKEQDPTMRFGEYKLFTPKEYKEFLRGS